MERSARPAPPPSTRFRSPPPQRSASPAPAPSRGNPNARKRMMAQGRKGHFMHDAKAALLHGDKPMDEVNVRPFLEGIFQRGTRQSTEDALLYLDEKVAAGTVTKDQGNALADLIERYSFWR